MMLTLLPQLANMIFSVGVGFRYFTEKKALEYGVTGWVRNTTTNKVEGEVQGEEDAVKKFTTAILDGPKHAHVVRLDKDHRAIVEGETGFEIRRD
ncbi:Acylphosphatase [Ceratocystis lukuohia]|uniref:acylphosphatase n=2 Tax=Ceratocystis TaxID=5157 RepID=A0A2C5WZ24_9PEZI|nr:Acylphosphatase [Ceratocystis fimbriata CBS 114723]